MYENYGYEFLKLVESVGVNRFAQGFGEKCIKLQHVRPRCEPNKKYTSYFCVTMT